MKITAVTPYIVAAGWRAWLLVKVETDTGCMVRKLDPKLKLAHAA
jgi:hypothetical protein